MQKVCCLAMLFFAGALARGATLDPVIYDNFGAGNAHQVGSGRTVLGPSFSTQQILAVRFTPAQTSTLTEIDVAGRLVSGTNSFLLSLAADSAGSPASTLNAIGGVSFPSGSGDPSGSYQSVVAPAGMSVTGGAPYWIVMTAGGSTSDAVWDSTIASLPGDLYKYNILDGNGWQTAPNVTATLRVTGIPIPEPATGMVAITAGLFVLRTSPRRLARSQRP